MRSRSSCEISAIALSWFVAHCVARRRHHRARHLDQPVRHQERMALVDGGPPLHERRFGPRCSVPPPSGRSSREIRSGNAATTTIVPRWSPSRPGNSPWDRRRTSQAVIPTRVRSTKSRLPLRWRFQSMRWAPRTGIRASPAAIARPYLTAIFQAPRRRQLQFAHGTRRCVGL